MTHEERARKWWAESSRSYESLTAEFAAVEREALERAALASVEAYPNLARVAAASCPYRPGEEKREETERETVAAIVEWLRRRAPHDGTNTHNTLADAIERGDWEK